MNKSTANQFLSRTAGLLHRMQTRVSRLDGDLVEQDIAARRQEALLGWEFAKQVDRIDAALKLIRSNLNIDQWCKQTCGCDISWMRRRKRLYKNWNEYEAARRGLGACGQMGLLFALSLVHDDQGRVVPALTRNFAPVRSVAGIREQSHIDTSRCTLITGDAATELPKLPAKSVNVIITSPPYWPAKRAYFSKGIGFEPTVEEYVGKLTSVLHQAQRVLRDDGTLWVCIDDSYRLGNLLFIPARFGMAMQADGWTCRSQIVWSKKGGGRPESVTNRARRDYEVVLMFTKRRNGYAYDSDHTRIPLVRPYTTAGQRKPGIYRRDFVRAERVWSNPMGRNLGSVWQIGPSSYKGSHAATMPVELVRRLLLLSCPEPGTVLDCFSGAGTTALTALQMGHRAIGIEISEQYTEEARRRIARDFVDHGDALAAD
jgi:site-specific DNA-methyltransferase (adenine-specific)